MSCMAIPLCYLSNRCDVAPIYGINNLHGKNSFRKKNGEALGAPPLLDSIHFILRKISGKKEFPDLLIFLTHFLGLFHPFNPCRNILLKLSFLSFTERIPLLENSFLIDLAMDSLLGSNPSAFL